MHSDHHGAHTEELADKRGSETLRSGCMDGCECVALLEDFYGVLY